MRVYIHTDIEGIAGWVFYGVFSSGTLWNHHHAERMNRLLTAEVNAAAQACKEAGATEVLVNDAHGHAYNILFEELDPVCRIIHGRGGHGPSWVPLLDESVDAAVAIGQHAMAGTRAAVCPHSCWHLTDGQGRTVKLSECTMFAALAGTHGVPMVAATGDDKLTAEVKEKIPQCRTAAVKQGLAPQNACSLTPSAARALVAKAVRDGLEHRGDIAPYTLEAPFRLNVSDRDPDKRELPEDMAGDDLWELMHSVCRVFGNRWGDQSIDDGSWRYPSV